MNEQLDMYGDLFGEEKPKEKPKPPPRPKRDVAPKLEQASKKILPKTTGKKPLQGLLTAQFEKAGVETDGLKTDLHKAGWEIILFGNKGLVYAFACDGLMWFTKGGEEVHYTEKECYPEEDLMQLTERDCKIIYRHGLEAFEYMTKTKEVWKDKDFDFLHTVREKTNTELQPEKFKTRKI